MSWENAFYCPSLYTLYSSHSSIGRNTRTCQKDLIYSISKMQVLYREAAKQWGLFYSCLKFPLNQFNVDLNENSMVYLKICQTMVWYYKHFKWQLWNIIHVRHSPFYTLLFHDFQYIHRVVQGSQYSFWVSSKETSYSLLVTPNFSSSPPTLAPIITNLLSISMDFLTYSGYCIKME